MRATFLKGVALGSAVSLATLAATAAFAGTGVGSVFDLGQTNRVNARSQLEGSTPSAVLNVTNSNRSSSASGLSIDVPGSSPPLVVNSSTKVKNLNADMVDGSHASDFQRSTSKSCANGTAIASVAPNGAAVCSTSVVRPIDQHFVAASSGDFAFAPSSLRLGALCEPNGSDINITNPGAAPATLSFAYTLTGGGAPIIGNMQLAANNGHSFDFMTQAVGQFIYFDQTTVATIDISALNLGEDGCELHGTVEIAQRST